MSDELRLLMPARLQKLCGFGKSDESAVDLQSGIPGVGVADHGVSPGVASLIGVEVEVDADAGQTGVVGALLNADNAA